MTSGEVFWGGVAAVIVISIVVRKGIRTGVDRTMANRQQELQAERNRMLTEVSQHQTKVEKDLALKRVFIEQMEQEFSKGYIQGRRWLQKLIVEASAARDEQIASRMERRPRPAKKAAEEVRQQKAEKRELLARTTHLEYLLKTLYEDYPVLGDYEDAILAGEATLYVVGSNDESRDPVANFLSHEDYQRLAPAVRNQLALDRWRARPKSAVEIGRMYERYVGFRYETEGWHVKYHGATQGLEDLGRDLICTKGDAIQIVQAKYWAAHKTIHEKHIFQTYGTAFLLGLESPNRKVRPILCCTCQVSDVARRAAETLGVAIKELPMDRDAPMIKCNINAQNKIYHLPFDQQYDRIVISPPDEQYVSTVVEAERLGFRRAMRWRG